MQNNYELVTYSTVYKIFTSVLSIPCAWVHTFKYRRNYFPCSSLTEYLNSYCISSFYLSFILNGICLNPRSYICRIYIYIQERKVAGHPLIIIRMWGDLGSVHLLPLGAQHLSQGYRIPTHVCTLLEEPGTSPVWITRDPDHNRWV